MGAHTKCKLSTIGLLILSNILRGLKLLGGVAYRVLPQILIIIFL